MTRDVDIAIVGAGFTGSALAIHLSDALSPSSTVALIDDAPALGRGLAYATTNPAHLLNVAAGNMSLYSDRTDDFVNWLAQSRAGQLGLPDHPTIAGTFVPRQWYGDYVGERLRCVLSPSSGRPAITPLPGRVLNIERQGDRWRVLLGDGSFLAAREVVLCTGNQASALPIPLASVAAELESRLIHDPWTDPRMEQIARNDSVLIVGSGLTMVDQVLNRETRGHASLIIAVSRRGLLPAPHVVPAVEPLPLAGVDEAESLLALLRLARGHLTEAEWRRTADGLRPHTQPLWSRMTDPERRQFLRHLAPYWGVARHRMAPQVAEVIGRARREGRLEVLAGRIERVEPGRDGRAQIRLRPRGQREVVGVAADWIVNCSGPERNIARSTDWLLPGLLRAGLCRVDALRLGIETTDENAVIAGDGCPWPSLYALGPLTMGLGDRRGS